MTPVRGLFLASVAGLVLAAALAPSVASADQLLTGAITGPTGQKVEGRLGRVDDFVVTLIEADGTSRTFRRDGENPKVEVHDPIQAHRDLMRTYTDKNIHDVTAYLVTVK